MTNQDERYKNYLFDLGFLLKEYALETKAKKDKEIEENVKVYYTGELMAYHRVISLMQQQAEAFGIPLSDLRLEDIIPDRDLV
jgi:hypothetical protein